MRSNDAKQLKRGDIVELCDNLALAVVLLGNSPNEVLVKSNGTKFWVTPVSIKRLVRPAGTDAENEERAR